MNIIIHSNNENVEIAYAEVIRDYINSTFKNEILNKIIIPKFENKDVLVQCIKVPLFSANTYS